MNKFFLIFFLNFGIFFAQPKELIIDSLLHKLAERGQFNGSILIAEHGKVIYENGFGKADKENNLDFTPTTPCYLASLTKQFTALAIMILEAQNKLTFSDPLSKYFPEFPSYAQKVTIRHLLNHTSGIPDYVGLGLEHPRLTDKEVLSALIKQDSLQFPAGDKFDYSNSGYILLAMIIEKVSGQKYISFLKKNIFDPLSMKNTFVFEVTKHKVKGLAHGYSRFGDKYDYDLLTYGEGGIFSSVEDMFKWDQALYSNKLVDQSKLKEAFTPGKLNDRSETNYGFGWAITNNNGQTIYSHAGRYGGFNSYIKRFSRDRNTIIFLTNNDFKNMSAIGNELINILYNKSYSLPKLSIAEEMNKIYLSRGIAPAIQKYRLLKANNDTTYEFGESELNEFGYHLLGVNKISDAIEILKLNAEIFPKSWNVYDGLGEAYMKNGQKEAAVKDYKKSLELNPQNLNAETMLLKMNQK